MITKVTYRPYVSGVNNVQNQPKIVGFGAVKGHFPLVNSKIDALTELLKKYGLTAVTTRRGDCVVLTNGNSVADRELKNLLGNTASIISEKEGQNNIDNFLQAAYDDLVLRMQQRWGARSEDYRRPN